jgi:membrane-bound metal-dependent hydrolase YbcI (DUF457 family)
LEPSKPLKLWSFLLAGVFGAVLHVVFDAFLYGAMLPLFPFSGNPFLGAYLSNYSVILVCVGMGIFGLGYYFALFVYGKTKDRTPTL